MLPRTSVLTAFAWLMAALTLLAKQTMTRRKGTTRRSIGMQVKASGMTALRRTALAGVVLVSAASVSRGWDPPLALAVTGTWSATDSMTAARIFHTATLLPSGKVLVAGGDTTGYGSDSNLASTELYDPATGIWSATGSMTTARVFHTATLLLSGKVLVAGGIHCCSDSGLSLASAELYDPATGTWSVTGSMTTPRAQYTATLLQSGKVLVAGGCCPNYGSLPSAELYDPVTGIWSPTGSMTTIRSGGHTAALLASGKVLVAGGCCLFRGGGQASAELYDPVADIWSATGSMTTARLWSTATLLPSGEVLVAGGNDGAGIVAITELYNPAGVPAPSCGLTHTGTDASGHTFIDITVQDLNSGLRVVKVTEATNASVVVPTFSIGTTSPHIVVATKTDQTKSSQVALQVTNVAGLVTNCDPILTEVGHDGRHAAPRVETFHHVAQGESQVTILNGTPGLTRLRLVVNRHAFEVAGLTDGENRLVDVSSAMRRGDNTLTLIAQGRTDGTASILIADK